MNQRIYEELLTVLDEKAARKLADILEGLAQPDLIRAIQTLTEAQQRTELRIGALVEAQQKTEAKVAELAEAQKRTEAKVAELAEAQRKTEERVSVLEKRMEELAEAQRRTEAKVAELAEAQKVMEEKLAILTARVDELTQAVIKLTQEVQAIKEWQRGEDGRRRGEGYEEMMIRKAPWYFLGGVGGSPSSAFVAEKLGIWLSRLSPQDLTTDESNPTLADLIWIKGEKVYVVEISLKVNGHDVERAWQRAQTLKKAGVEVVGVVMGEEWSHPEALEKAKTLGLAWWVGGKPSKTFQAIRQRTPAHQARG